LQHDRSNAAGSVMSDSDTSVASSASRSASASGLNLVVDLSSYMLHHHQTLVLSASLPLRQWFVYYLIFNKK